MFSQFQRPSRYKTDPAFKQTKPDLLIQVLEVNDISPSSKASTSEDTLFKVFGVTDHDESIVLNVHNFEPYVYFPVTAAFTKDDIPELERLLTLTLSGGNSNPKVSITGMEIVEREPLMFYRGDEADAYRHFLKITFNNASQTNKISKLLESLEVVLPNYYRSDTDQPAKLYDSTVYEANFPFDLRFMVDRGIVGGGWIWIPGGSYEFLSDDDGVRNVSFGIRVSAGNVVGLSISEKDDMMGMRILGMMCYFHEEPIEATSTPPSSTSTTTKSKDTKSKEKKKPAGKGKRKQEEQDVQPESSKQKLTAIAVKLSSSIAKRGSTTSSSSSSSTTSSSTPSSFDTTLLFSTLSLNDATSLPDKLITPLSRHVQYHRFNNELDLLKSFAELFKTFDPDIVTGYDVPDDIARLIDLCDTLSTTSTTTPPKSKRKVIEKIRFEFESFLGRSNGFTGNADEKNCAKDFGISVSRRQIYSAHWVRSQKRMAQAASNRAFTLLTIPGRLILDVHQILDREKQLRTYSLPEAISSVLNITHEVVPILRDPQNPALLRRKVLSLTRDIERVVSMLDTLGSIVTSVELARVSGINISDTYQRGQMVRFWSLLFRHCHQHRIAIPTIPPGNEGMTEGPVNFYPEPGLNTTDTCVVLDFKSLYPSIIISHNLCYSTLVITNGNGDQTSQQATFVPSETKKGVVPTILESLIAERDSIKQQYRSTTDPAQKQMFHGRQLALKVSANAIYGFLGAAQSKLQCLAIAQKVITTGAAMLIEARESIEAEFRVARGFPVDVKVVYGDTDSIFVKLPSTSVADAIRLGKIMSERISVIWRRPIQLEFEKVYFPFFLINRKRYAGLEWSRPDRPDKIDAKGIESQRRDSCLLLTNVMTKVLEILFPFNKSNNAHLVNDIITADERKAMINKAVEYTRNVIRKLLLGEYDMGQFIVTKGLWLGTESGDYKAKQVHVELVERMKKRDPSREFREGERIPFVFIQSSPNARAYEKSEDPQYALDNHLPLDYHYYLHHQLESQLTRLFELLIPTQAVNDLFHGEHTKVSIAGRVAGGGASPVSSLATTTTSSPSTPMKKQGTKSLMSTPKSTGSTSSPRMITSFFGKSQTVTNCLSCRTKIPFGEGVCKACLFKAPSLYAEAQSTLSTNLLRDAIAHNICRGCQGSSYLDVVCENMDCPVYFQRVKIERERPRLVEEMERLEKSVYGMEW